MPAPPEDLPWDSMTPRVLEELVYALLEEMGAASIEWRSTDKSINEADGGRDIEATFNRPTPDDDIERETWWIECKERQRPVSPSVVKESVLNSAAFPDVKAFIIASNSTFSNKTIDWIKSYNERQTGPAAKLWDRRRLQSLVAKYPSAAARTLVAALDLDERCSFLAAYFFDSSRSLNESELSDAWESRDQISDANFLVAACYADINSGKIGLRPWVTTQSSPETVLFTLTIALTNLIAKVLRGEPVSNTGVVETCAFLIGVAATTLPPEVVSSILDNPYTLTDSEEAYAEAAREALIDPCRAALLANLEARCSDDCARHHADYEPTDAPENYWSRFTHAPSQQKRRLIMINLDMPCAIGIPTSDSVHCPLDSIDNPETTTDYVKLVKAVIDFRSNNPTGQWMRVRSENPSDSSQRRLVLKSGGRVLVVDS